MNILKYRVKIDVVAHHTHLHMKDKNTVFPALYLAMLAVVLASVLIIIESIK